MVEDDSQQPSRRSLFEKWAELAVRALNTESEAAGALIPHNLRKGSERESLLRNALLRVLPSSLEIGTGHIFDGKGTPSRQIDIVVARRDFPVIRFSDGTTHYLAEGVLAAIEVKSYVDAPKAKNALDNCKSVNALHYTVMKGDGNKGGDGDSGEIRRRLRHHFGLTLDDSGSLSGPLRGRRRFTYYVYPATCIFSYKENGSVKDYVSDWLKANDIAHAPSLFVAGRHVAFRNDDCLSIDGRVPIMVYGEHRSDPLAVVVSQVLQVICRRMPVVPDRFGICHSMQEHVYHPSVEVTGGTGDFDH